MRKSLLLVGLSLLGVVVLFVALVIAGPSVYCPSVWSTGSLANITGREKALEAISTFEKTNQKPALLSVVRSKDEGRLVQERWKVQLGAKVVFYDVEYFYIPGGPVCGPEFRSVVRREQ